MKQTHKKTNERRFTPAKEEKSVLQMINDYYTTR
ncbi:hypothetical protein SAMN05192534_101344 [Alteribacillus persepolensis]|uniref:Uncharacterized protein n=1 Tax=Alteribacillus persepolensis TaxID=568899 RepID=A0A1G7Z0C7_9BACI|nr:hypothetical protein SAMN05192534_101344 [Alteribacillus persepolensis]